MESEPFKYRPRKVVSIENRDKIRKMRGHKNNMRGQGRRDYGVVKRGAGWVARVRHNGKEYESQILPTQELAEAILPRLLDRANDLTYRGLL